MGLRLFFNPLTISLVLRQAILASVCLGQKLHRPARMVLTGSLVGLTTAPCKLPL